VTSPGLMLIDRDGVLLEHVDPYILSTADACPVAGSFEAVTALARVGIGTAIVSNQSPIGQGLVSRDIVEEINHMVVAGIERSGGSTIGIWYCPHMAADGCRCRKPEPGLLLDAMRVAGVAPQQAWMVGDHDTDIAAGWAAGCARTIHVLSGRQATPAAAASAVHRNLSEAVTAILAGSPR
jgi:D-glycero-D-manno-heptose 1,7-bisphosphate phosphatase